jgi:calnexin
MTVFSTDPFQRVHFYGIGEWSIGLPSEEILAGDYGLIVRTKARHHAIAAKLQTPFEFTGKALVLQ